MYKWYWANAANTLALQMARSGDSAAAIIEEILKRKWLSHKHATACAVRAVRYVGNGTNN